MRLEVHATIAATLVACLSCRPVPSSPAPPPFEPVATIAELMQRVVDPSADQLWASVGSVVTESGVEDFFPRSEDEWIALENAATVLMESGNLLMIGDRAKDQGDWMTLSRGLVDAGELALAAARSRNPDQIFRVGGDVYDACSACHERYQVKPAAAEAPVAAP